MRLWAVTDLAIIAFWDAANYRPTDEHVHSRVPGGSVAFLRFTAALGQGRLGWRVFSLGFGLCIELAMSGVIS